MARPTTAVTHTGALRRHLHSRGVPTVLVGDKVFWGDDRLDEAAATAADRRRGDHALS